MLAGLLLGVFEASADQSASAQSPLGPPSAAPEVLIVLDQSGSMSDWISGGRKIELAAEAIDITLAELAEQGTTAAVMGFAGSCTEWPPSSLENLQPVHEIDWDVEGDSLWADGGTPTDVALLGAMYRLGIVDAQLQPTGADVGTIVLISDGESNGCTNPCEVAAEYGAGHVTVHSIGFDLAQTSAAVDELSCIAHATGGVAVTVNDYESLRDEVRMLAALRGEFEFRRVEPVGARLEVEISLSNNVALADAFLRIGGPAEFLDSTEIIEQLGDLEPGISSEVDYTWHANACSSLSDIVDVSLGGLRDEEYVEEPVHITTVEEILLHGMTERELRRRCSGFISAADANLISSMGTDATGANPPSEAFKYYGIGFASFAAALAARRRRREEDAQQAQQLVSTVQSLKDGADDIVGRAKIGIHKRVTGSFSGSQGYMRLSLDKAGKLGKVIGRLDDAASFKLKAVPVVGSGLALAACAVNDPTAECLICSGSALAAASGAAAVVGASTFGILAIPAGLGAGEVMQFLWEHTFLADLGGWVADVLGPITWAAEGAVEGIGDGVSYFWDGTKKIASSAWDAGSSAAEWAWDNTFGRWWG